MGLGNGRWPSEPNAGARVDSIASPVQRHYWEFGWCVLVVLDVETKSSTAKNLQSTLYPIYPFTLLVKNKVFEVVLGFDHRDQSMVVDANLERVRVETNLWRG